MSRTTMACRPIKASYLAGGPVQWREDRDDINGDAAKDTFS